MSDESEVKPAPKLSSALITDGIFIVGIGFIFSGVAMIHVPSALICAGLAMIVLAFQREKVE